MLVLGLVLGLVQIARLLGNGYGGGGLDPGKAVGEEAHGLAPNSRKCSQIGAADPMPAKIAKQAVEASV